MPTRILDVLNFSNGRNPLGDSGVRLQKELIECLHRRRPDFLFYLLVPKETESALKPLFKTRNVQLIPSSCISRQQGGAHHFDVREIERTFDLCNFDVDVLFINQPELTPAFLNYFNKVHFFDVHSLGYVHWMDWRRYDNVKNRWNVPSNLAVLTSILISEATGCNSEYGKRRILQEAARFFNQATVEKIEKKLVILRPGVNVAEIRAAKTERRNRLKSLIAPYRTQKYTGFKSLVENHLAQLWLERQDFQLILTNPSSYDYVKRYSEKYPFVRVHDFTRKEYLRALWEADIVVACHPGTSQWSLAVIEALASDCIPLFNGEGFLKELLLTPLSLAERDIARDRYLYYRSSFCKKLSRLLDNLEAERLHCRSIGKRIRRFYNWEKRIEDWITILDRVDRVSPELKSASCITRKIDGLLKATGACSKQVILQALKWHPKSRYISWTRYRKYLRQRYLEGADTAAVTFAYTPQP
jgi:glycosyltransferase involved in cell wall biosynthesis